MATCLVRASALRFLYAAPLLFMAPIWFAMAPVGIRADLLLRVRKACAAMLAVCMVASPAIALFGTATQKQFVARPKSEIVRAVTDEWHKRFGVPLGIVGGSEDYAIAAPFYSRDSPSYVSGFDRRMRWDFGQDLGPSRPEGFGRFPEAHPAQSNQTPSPNLNEQARRIAPAGLLAAALRLIRRRARARRAAAAPRCW